MDGGIFQDAGLLPNEEPGSLDSYHNACASQDAYKITTEGDRSEVCAAIR